MIITLKIEDAKPRDDEEYIIARIRGYLAACDPDDRVDIEISRPAH